MLVIVSDELLEKDQGHERADDRDAVFLNDLDLMHTLFHQVCNQTLSVLVEASLLVFEFALLSQNIDVVQCFFNLSNLTLKGERNELHLLRREDLSGRIFGVNQFSKFFHIKQLKVFLLGVIDLWCSRLQVVFSKPYFFLHILFHLCFLGHRLLFSSRCGQTCLQRSLFGLFRPLVSLIFPPLFCVPQILFKSGDHVVPLSRLLGDPDCQDTLVHLIINFF